jgi:hypothetical protein
MSFVHGAARYYSDLYVACNATRALFTLGNPSLDSSRLKDSF